MPNGDQLQEPPALEGYLHQVKATSQAKALTYLTTHDGYLFFLRTADANPPTPPGAMLDRLDKAVQLDDIRKQEVFRGREQVMAARRYCDLRSVAAVRKAERVVRVDGAATLRKLLINTG